MNDVDEGPPSGILASWAYRIGDGRTVLAAIAPADTQALGLLPEIAILGAVPGELTPAGFVDNPVFVRLLHEMVQQVGTGDPELHRAAVAQSVGHVYVIDGRSPTPEDRVSPEDIIGAFPLRDGRVVAEEYQPNPNHRLFTERGVTRPKAIVLDALRRAMQSRAGLA